MKGIIAKYECPSCGNTIEKSDVLKTNAQKSKYTFDAPTKCTCGQKGKMKLTSFKSASVVIKADDEVE